MTRLLKLQVRKELIRLERIYRSEDALPRRDRWCPGWRETIGVILCAYLGVFKIFFLVFNVVPYVALRIIA